jgi:cytochrome c-type biogenesis protein CcmF
LANWTVLLAIIGFGLALLGTFLVRSGVLTSVHAFAVDPRRGIAVLALLSLALGAGFTLYGLRAQKLGRATGFAALSRESMLVWNNYGLAVAAGVVLIGTLYPMIVEAAGGGLISVGPPFFNATVTPLLGALFLLLPFGPMLTWRIGDIGAAARKLSPALLLALGALGAVLSMAPGRAAAALGIAIGVWLIAGGLVYLWQRVQRGDAGMVGKALALPLAVWSMSAAHIGAGVLTVGAVGETAFRSERAAALAPGESVDFAGQRITMLEIGERAGPNYSAIRAVFRVERDGNVRTIAAERRSYPTAAAPTSEVGILSRLDGDLYIALGEPAERSGAQWVVRLHQNPLVQLLFAGMAMMAGGGLLSWIALMRRRPT